MNWNQNVDNFLLDLGFVNSDADTCIYIKTVGDPCIIALYVDDLLIGCKSVKQLNSIKSSLSAKYDMKDMGQLKFFLGVQVEQNDDLLIRNSCLKNSVLKILIQFSEDNHLGKY